MVELAMTGTRGRPARGDGCGACSAAWAGGRYTYGRGMLARCARS